MSCTDFWQKWKKKTSWNMKCFFVVYRQDRNCPSLWYLEPLYLIRNSKKKFFFGFKFHCIWPPLFYFILFLELIHHVLSIKSGLFARRQSQHNPLLTVVSLKETSVDLNLKWHLTKLVWATINWLHALFCSLHNWCPEVHHVMNMTRRQAVT